MTRHEGPAAPGRGPDEAPAPAEPEGGDSACWLHRVCPYCDAVADEDPPTVCRRCHRPLTG